MRLQGKSILITAAGQGIGRASALACARGGAQGIATDIDAALLERLAAAASGLAAHVPGVGGVGGGLRAVDGLFKCAGFVHNGSILDCDEAAWDFSMDLNVKGAYRMTRAFLAGMLDKMAR